MTPLLQWTFFHQRFTYHKNQAIPSKIHQEKRSIYKVTESADQGKQNILQELLSSAEVISQKRAGGDLSTTTVTVSATLYGTCLCTPFLVGGSVLFGFPAAYPFGMLA